MALYTGMYNGWHWYHCCILCYVLSLSHVWLLVTPRTVTSQTPLSMGILWARILEWVAMPSSRASSEPRDRKANSLPAEPPGSPRILEWVAYPFSRGSSWPRNWTRVSCTAGRFFTSWATREIWYTVVYILPNLPLKNYTNSHAHVSIYLPSLLTLFKVTTI